MNKTDIARTVLGRQLRELTPEVLSRHVEDVAEEWKTRRAWRETLGYFPSLECSNEEERQDYTESNPGPHC